MKSIKLATVIILLLIIGVSALKFLAKQTPQIVQKVTDEARRFAKIYPLDKDYDLDHLATNMQNRINQCSRKIMLLEARDKPMVEVTITTRTTIRRIWPF